MKNKIIYSFALACLLAIPTIAQKKADLNVFGLLKIGEKITLPECSKESFIVESPCRSSEFKPKDGVSVYITIAVPYSEKPAITADNKISSEVINDIVEGVTFYTNETEDRESIITKLKEKYGAPSTSNETETLWTFDNLVVRFYFDKRGFVIIDSPENWKRRQAYLKGIKDKRRSL